MSWWSRVANVFRGDRLNREIDVELQSHIDEAIEQGRDREEAQRAFGSALRRREESRDIRLLAWLDALRADSIFGWRQITRNKVTSAAAIVSLAVAIGSCTSAFRLIDALLLRPLPVSEPDRLYVVSRQEIRADGTPWSYEECPYPLFSVMRAAVQDQAELLAISLAVSADLTYGSDQDMERVHWQWVSGQMFASFGLRPALGRLLTEDDDRTPGAHPYAVLSHDYWTHRFGQDPHVIGRTFRMDKVVYEIVGVAGERFTGTETGTVTDVFVPTMMHRRVTRVDATWVRTWARLKPGVAVEPVRARLASIARAFETERAKGFTDEPQAERDRYINQTLSLEPAAAGVSMLQKDYGRALMTLGVLVALVLLIACANVANLMTAQAAARAREMALRVSIGAGRGRLVQLVLVESAWLACLAAAIGGLFAWWSAPFIVRLINPPDNPVRLFLPADWRVLGFGVALALGVTCLFGLAPALRASAVKPVSALKGGEEAHAWRRVMHALIASQVAFCFLVLFIAGLSVATFDRLSHQPVGFSAERLLTLETRTSSAQPPAVWDDVAEHLRAVPGVEKVAMSAWPLLSANSWNGYLSIDGKPQIEEVTFFLGISPGWTDVMKIPLIAGRDFRAGDTYPGAAIVNETFAKRYFNGESPLGRSFVRTGSPFRFEIVGVVADARYRSIREPVPSTAYVPLLMRDDNGVARGMDYATFIVRTASADPLALAPTLREEVRRVRPAFRVGTIRTQQQLNQSHTTRERLLATLASFFAVVALLLAGVGLYGVLDYSVLQRRREFGIRLAIGAHASDIVLRVTRQIFSMVLAGAIVGLALGMIAARYLDALFYQVKATDLAMVALPWLTLLAVTVMAALVPVIRALRIDPVTMLRAE
jgi:predicted permease